MTLTPAAIGSAPISVTEVRHVLVIRPDEIGDVVLTTPLLRELRRALPDAWITLVVKAATADLVAPCPYVNEVLIFGGQAPKPFRSLRKLYRVWRMALTQLRRRRFDLAILPRWDTDWYAATSLAQASGARWRVGYTEQATPKKQRRNKGYDRALTHVLPAGEVAHEVTRNLNVLRALGIPVTDERLELWLTPEDQAFADAALQGHDATMPLIGIGPSGGASPLKQWPLERMITLCQWLGARNCRQVLFGGPDDTAIGEEIVRAVGDGVINLIGRASLRQGAAVQSRCACYVGNDSGPMHIAAAVGTPVIALFGPSCSHRFGPWGVGHQVLGRTLECSPCTRGHLEMRCPTCEYPRPRCLEEITLEQVQAAVGRVVAGMTIPTETV